ncbi:hypothetical protein Pan216_22250 [Planctomycetes bacterium Pan216]|uniref:Uncharacterized protein n=1 Tax=Kolteria novifilia TaxID=2527975 RepID=A0A518B304_9BACT|nr:hypothetical protein Pan216_22250 [Planctomycetes bacterium Pan216]
MESLIEIGSALGQVIAALWLLLQTIVFAVATHWVMVAWICFWLFLVRWADFSAQLQKGGWPAFGLLYVITALTWGLVTEPSYINAPSILEKFLLLAFWIAIAFMCGALQEAAGWAPQKIDIHLPPEDGVKAGH